MPIYEGDRHDGLTEYMRYGGMPSVLLRKDEIEKEKILLNLYKEIYIPDIKMRNHIRNVKDLDDLLNILSSSVGSLTNPEKLKNTFKSKAHSSVTSATIKKYLDYLEDSFSVEASTRYDIKGKSYIETPRKYLFY